MNSHQLAHEMIAWSTRLRTNGSGVVTQVMMNVSRELDERAQELLKAPKRSLD